MLNYLKWTTVVFLYATVLLHLTVVTEAAHVQEFSSLKDEVIELNDSNFDGLVLNSEYYWLVNFYAPWCPASQQFAPDFAEASRIMKTYTGKAKLGALDITKHPVKAAQHDIHSYPTIKYFPPGSSSPSGAKIYRFSRIPNDFVAFVLNKMAHRLNVELFKA